MGCSFVDTIVKLAARPMLKKNFREKKEPLSLTEKKKADFLPRILPWKKLSCSAPGSEALFEALALTFKEILQLVENYNKTSEKKVGICPEIKHPLYHQKQGLPLEGPLLALLQKYGYRTADDLCVIQSFDAEILKKLAKKTDLRLLQLLPHKLAESMLPFVPSDAQLKEISEYASVIGLHKKSIFADASLRGDNASTELIARAKRQGCRTWIYTFRETPLSALFGASMGREVRRSDRLGADGLITDFPDLARRALAEENPVHLQE